ncbi:SdpI family protein [Laceyella tengchongensis]|jgi:uncharacterized membrane protein
MAHQCERKGERNTMKHLHKPYLILSWAIALVTLGVFLYCHDLLPDRVPLHWNIKGQIDRYGSKNMLLLFGLIPLGINLLLTFLPNWDPRRDRYVMHSKAYSILLLYSTVILCAVFLSILAITLGYPINIPLLLQLLIGILLMAIGNYLPQVRQTFFFGIRTPWSITSEDNWRLTHRFGGKVLFFIGLLMIISLFLPVPLRSILPFAAIIIGLAIIYWYSYRLYKHNRT